MSSDFKLDEEELVVLLEVEEEEISRDSPASMEDAIVR